MSVAAFAVLEAASDGLGMGGFVIEQHSSGNMVQLVICFPLACDLQRHPEILALKDAEAHLDGEESAEGIFQRMSA